MAGAVTWNTTFESTPSGSNPGSILDDSIRTLKVGIEERVKNEHTTYVDDDTEGVAEADWLHKEGSGVIFCQDEAPTTAPAGGALRNGMMWFDLDDGILYVYDEDDAAAWVEVVSTDDFFVSGMDLDLSDGGASGDRYINFSGTNKKLFWDTSENAFLFMNCAGGLTLGDVTGTGSYPLFCTAITCGAITSVGAFALTGSMTGSGTIDVAGKVKRMCAYLQETSATEDDIYEFLKDFVPDVDDIMTLSGSGCEAGTGTKQFFFAAVKRTSATVLTLYGQYRTALSAQDNWSDTVTNDSTTAIFDQVTMSVG